MDESINLTAEAAEQRREAEKIEKVNVSTHASKQWIARAYRSETGPRAAWTEAEPIHYPSARDGAVARYHAPTGMVLLVQGRTLVTVISLRGRELLEREYVEAQVVDHE